MRISDWSSDVCSSDLATISHHDCCGGADGQVVRVQATCPVLDTSAQRDGYRYIPAWRRLLRPRTAATSNIDYCRVRLGRHRIGTHMHRRRYHHPPASGHKLGRWAPAQPRVKPGRATGRERVCSYVAYWVVNVSTKTQ